MMKILVAVDKSEESQQALRACCHLLDHMEAEVDALYVQPDVVDMVADSSYAPFASKGDVEKGTAGDVAPEVVTFISADKSPTGQAILVVANEVSGSVSAFGLK